MKKRNYPKLIILSSILSGMFFNCSSFDKIMDAEKVEPLQAEIRIEIELEGFDSRRVIDRSHGIIWKTFGLKKNFRDCR